MIKQLSNNPSPKSVSHGWTLLELMLMTFAPSPDLEPFLEMFLMDRKEDGLVKKLHAIVYGLDPPKGPPRMGEIDSVRNSRHAGSSRSGAGTASRKLGAKRPPAVTRRPSASSELAPPKPLSRRTSTGGEPASSVSSAAPSPPKSVGGHVAPKPAPKARGAPPVPSGRGRGRGAASGRGASGASRGAGAGWAGARSTAHTDGSRAGRGRQERSGRCGGSARNADESRGVRQRQ